MAKKRESYWPQTGNVASAMTQRVLWWDAVTKVDADVLSLPEYGRFIQDLKRRVSESRLVAARAVNRELILLYWDIGKAIAGKLAEAGWGESVVKVVSRDLRASFPGISGFSSQNVWRMLQFYRAHSDPHFLEQIEIVLESEERQAASDEKISQAVREMVARKRKSFLATDVKGRR